MAVYPLLMGCLSLAVWREGERGKKEAENGQKMKIIFFSASHNLGEFFSFLFVGGLVSLFGWQYGFIGAAVAGAIGVILIVCFLYDSPESQGLPSPSMPKDKPAGDASVGKAQLSVLRNPYVWVLAFASAFMYISRYAVNGWGVLYLQEAKGYELASATQIISINALLGIIGTVFSGWLSDVAFRGNRYILCFVRFRVDSFPCLFC